MDDVIAVILGGGRGTRLFPLTQYRSKPAVPIGGAYRLVDVPISNCVHANLRRIFVLTQYQSESLNTHVAETYKFDMFSSGFVEILAAEQTETRSDWFQGTADAVRRSMNHLARERWSEMTILAGDQLYRMNFQEMLQAHRQSGADATVAIKTVREEETSAFGIMKIDKDGRILHFEEKPAASRLPDLASQIPGHSGPAYLASMGIYIFGRRALEVALAEEKHIDFGRHVIPAMLSRMRVQAYLYDGYWEDVGTIRSYYEANLALTRATPPFSFYDARYPIYTQPRFLGPTKVESCQVRQSLLSDGCCIDGAEIEESIIGIRAHIGNGVRVRRSLILGADHYASVEEREHSRAGGTPAIGIGENSRIDTAIIDKNARIGRHVTMLNEARVQERDGDNYYIREGIIIVPKGGVIRDGTVI